MFPGAMAKRPADPKDMKDQHADKKAAPAGPKKPTTEPPMKTRTLPESQRGVYLEGPDVVTSLQIFGSATEFPLLANVKRFTLGSAADCDVSVREPSLSKLHCLLERRGTALRVTDQGSYNGTYFDGRRETTFDLRPGNTFTASGLRFLALNDEMRAAYPRLVDILGGEDDREVRPGTFSPHDLILAAIGGAHALITGEPGCDQMQLAQIIHSISLRRGHELVELSGDVPADRVKQRAILDRASRSTIVISLDSNTPVMDGTFASSLYTPTYQIRVIALAPTSSVAAAVLGAENLTTASLIPVRPLAMRPTAVPHLLDRLLAERGSSLRASEMTPANQAGLQAYGWPQNLIDLRAAADRLAVIHEAPSGRQAAAKLGLHHSTLQYWLDQIGLTFPLVAE